MKIVYRLLSYNILSIILWFCKCNNNQNKIFLFFESKNDECPVSIYYYKNDGISRNVFHLRACSWGPTYTNIIHFPILNDIF